MNKYCFRFVTKSMFINHILLAEKWYCKWLWFRCWIGSKKRNNFVVIPFLDYFVYVNWYSKYGTCSFMWKLAKFLIESSTFYAVWSIINNGSSTPKQFFIYVRPSIQEKCFLLERQSSWIFHPKSGKIKTAMNANSQFPLLCAGFWAQSLSIWLIIIEIKNHVPSKELLPSVERFT